MPSLDASFSMKHLVLTWTKQHQAVFPQWERPTVTLSRTLRNCATKAQEHMQCKLQCAVGMEADKVWRQS